MTHLRKLPLIDTPLFNIASKPIPYSRVHRLRSFQGTCFVKRDDELGFGISGTKVRKYLSFLPAFLENKPEEAIVIGSAYSNHVLSLSQLLKENGVKPILFLLGDPSCKLQGNLALTALIAGLENIHWVSRKQWKEVDGIAFQFAAGRSRAAVVPKGANCASSLPGALTLALDILRNEEELGAQFDHILIDSGTGLTACALILSFALLGKKAFVHVLQVAGDEEEFKTTLAERKKDLEHLLRRPLPSPTQFKLYLPKEAPSFGSISKTLFDTIAEVAQSEGFLTDPVFTAKLFHEGRRIIAEEGLTGNVLFIHSGGGLGLMGFQDEIAIKLKNR